MQSKEGELQVLLEALVVVLLCWLPDKDWSHQQQPGVTLPWPAFLQPVCSTRYAIGIDVADPRH